MGNQNVKGESADPLSSNFNADEQQKIKQLFHQLSTGRHEITEGQFQAHTVDYIGDERSKKLFQIFCNFKKSKNQQNGISPTNFSHSLAYILKGTLSEKSEVILSLCCIGSSSVSYTSVEEVVRNLLHSFTGILKKSPEYVTWGKQLKTTPESISAITSHILLKLKGEERELTASDIEKCLTESSFFREIFDVVFHKCFEITSSKSSFQMLPTVRDVNWFKVSTILTAPYVVFLSENLPLEFRKEWRLLFSNTLYGDSFSQLVSKIVNKGPSLLLIRDKAGHMFGGFASVAWEINSNFIGNEKCFLFSLQPNCGIYLPSGYNEHYMYLNQGVQTLPNGLGMGGQFDYFGLWIDQSFNQGHSKAKPKCTTYGSPQLSDLENFDVDIVEVWAIGPEPKKDSDDEEEGPKHKSVLDKDPESKAMLELLGKGPVSEGLREGDETADSPEYNKLLPLH